MVRQRCRHPCLTDCMPLWVCTQDSSGVEQGMIVRSQLVRLSSLSRTPPGASVPHGAKRGATGAIVGFLAWSWREIGVETGVRPVRLW